MHWLRKAEGTLAPPLLRFKKGPFVLALKNKLPVLPVLIKGSSECMPKGSWFFNTKALKSKVSVTWLAPIDTNTFLPYNFKNATRLKEHLHKTMLQK